MKRKGYYSLIQYCHDLSRQERLNVGIVILVPGEPVYVRVASHSVAIRALYGVSTEAQVIRGLGSVESGLGTRNITTLAALEKFVSTRANNFQMTRPVPMKLVASAEDTLVEMFARLVL